MKQILKKGFLCLSFAVAAQLAEAQFMNPSSPLHPLNPINPLSPTGQLHRGDKDDDFRASKGTAQQLTKPEKIAIVSIFSAIAAGCLSVPLLASTQSRKRLSGKARKK